MFSWTEVVKNQKPNQNPQLYRRWLQQKDPDFQAKLVCMPWSGLYESDTDGRLTVTSKLTNPCSVQFLSSTGAD